MLLGGGSVAGLAVGAGLDDAGLGNAGLDGDDSSGIRSVEEMHSASRQIRTPPTGSSSGPTESTRLFDQPMAVQAVGGTQPPSSTAPVNPRARTGTTAAVRVSRRMETA